MRVALLDSNHVALTVARSLHEKGIAVDLLRIDRSIADCSVCANEVIDFRTFSENVEATYRQLEQHLRQSGYDLLIPITDAANEICRTYHSDLSSACKLAMASPSSLKLLANKQELLRLCSELGIPYPASRIVRSLDDLQSLQRTDLRFPLYLKPETSVKIINNRILYFKVKKVDSVEELKEFCMLNQHSVAVIVQDSIEGTGVGVHLIARSGTVLAMVAQRRLHEPIDGGPGSYRESFPVPQQLGHWTKELVRATKYTGVAMVELKGSHKDWYLMEVNARFWGSLPLTVNAGLDLPFWLTTMHTQPERLPELGIPAAPGSRFQRNLKRDLGWLFVSLRKSPRRVELAVNWARSFSNLLAGTEGIDFFSVRDPMPFLYDWIRLFTRPLKKLGTRWRRLSAAFLYLTRRRSRMARLRPILAGKEANILILCFGNICRSPFAEGCLKQTHGYDRVLSAGVHPQEDNVDLAGHKSRHRLSPPTSG